MGQESAEVSGGGGVCEEKHTSLDTTIPGQHVLQGREHLGGIPELPCSRIYLAHPSWYMGRHLVPKAIRLPRVPHSQSTRQMWI